MTPEQFFQFLALIGGLGGVGSVIAAIMQKRKIVAEATKSGADAAQVLSAASVALLAPMEKQINLLSAQLVTSQTRADALHDSLTATQQELRDTQRMAHELNLQLRYYRNKYGPPTGELEPVR